MTLFSSLASRSETFKIIRGINDKFRKNGNNLMLRGDVLSLDAKTLAKAIQKVRNYDFPPEDDPFDEHAFACLPNFDITVWWKIDYYDNTLQHAAPDPTDPIKTKRILTIFLPEQPFNPPDVSLLPF